MRTIIELSKVMHEDFEELGNTRNYWDVLTNSTILITGAGGFIGSVLVRFLLFMNMKFNLSIKIIAIVKEKDTGKGICANSCIVIAHDLTAPIIIDWDIDYIFHCASITQSKKMISTPVEVIDINVSGTRNILRLAVEKGIKSIVYLSSMEVYGNTNTEFVSEENLGYIEIDNPRSCYPESKRMAECLCYAAYHEYDIPVKVARLAQTFGAGAPKGDMRVFAQFARSVLAKSDIVLHTDGSSVGNYVYIADAIDALFLLLLNGAEGHAYNIAAESMTIRQMAEFVASELACGNINIVFDAFAGNQHGYATPSESRLATDKIKALGWRPRYNLGDMYKRMMSDWNSNNGN